ncbi:hypothetical protein L2E82_45827 [Cichorium intybus]|uniref:Uncharacterized protein n=1 Tax=Cichorium intybus TaxID=13427 RepID=A0ACB8ZU09_CICIN|nr:hypothetical protein L2E82_45827 [Cichorium intybus]
MGKNRSVCSFNLKQKDEELTQKDKELMSLVRCSDKLTKFWRSSPYFLEDPSVDGKKDESRIKRPPLSDYMMTTSDYLPSDLALQKMDIFEKLDQGQDEEKKEDEDEDEDEDMENIEEDEDYEDDDYAQNQDFDDDEDDFNMNDGFGDDEGCY